MKKLYVLLLVVIIFGFSAFSQSIDQIKGSPQMYIYGEGVGSTLDAADQSALQQIISQISTQVESSFQQITDQTNTNNKLNYNEKVVMVVKTYSRATLTNAERIVVSNEPDAHVFRYIKRSDVYKVFEQRKNKINEFANAGLQAEANNQIADALRYYYWALLLLKSHPNANEIYNETNGTKNFLMTWLPVQINNIFANLRISVKKSDYNGNSTVINLFITHKNNPVVNFDYSFWDGKDWSNIYSAKDGEGFIEFTGSTTDLKEIKLKSEYIFGGEARIDKELEEVMQTVDAVPFKNSYLNVKTENSQSANQISNPNKTILPQSVIAIDVRKYQNKINTIVQAIKNNGHTSIQNLFTADGYKMYMDLIAWGNVRVLEEPVIQAAKCNNQVMCRSVKMSFSFKNNKRKFVEDVVFMFNEQNLVDAVSFGLGNTALNDILNKQKWSESDRMLLINFLETYKTAYALKRLDYLESIFADDALIIVGSVLKTKQNADNQYKQNQIVRLNKLTKQQYMKGLKACFSNNEYVNLKFEDSDIRKSGKGGNIYGIQIKQNYFSENYGDTGYLFLMVDLNDPNAPVIHVRTWQPEKATDGTIYGIEDF